MGKIELKLEDIRVEPLTINNQFHIKSFYSIVCRELEDFLKENAWKEQEIDYSKTYLFFHNGILAGYATLLTDKQSLKHDHSHPSLATFQDKVDKPYSSVPALKIGRICVADNYNSQLQEAQYSGLGTIMFTVILDYAKSLAAKVGCRVITSHSKKSTGAHSWYLKLGFQFSNKEEKVKELLAREDCASIPMFYDIRRIVI
ncbi:MAG: hypothetical protein AABX05_02085 [Nanoarchaeota archaeon]